MVGQDGRDEGHYHQRRKIRHPDLQSGFAYSVGAESESAANEPPAATFPGGNAATAATLHKASADPVAPPTISAGKANSASPEPPAGLDSTKSYSKPAPDA